MTVVYNMVLVNNIISLYDANKKYVYKFDVYAL